jgi:hypothetical protein
MCIAILNNGTPVTKKHLKNSWDSNFDGAGLMWAQDGKMHTYKRPNKFKEADFEEFYATYQRVLSQRDADTPVGIHFRIATHGKTSKFLHPFPVSENVYLMHNGVLSGLGTQDYSDTAKLADLLSKLPAEMTKSVDALLSNDFVYTALASMCGASNKLIFMDNTGDFEIIGVKLGHWTDDNWYSNDSYKNTGVRYYGSEAVYDWKNWAKTGNYGKVGSHSAAPVKPVWPSLPASQAKAAAAQTPKHVDVTSRTFVDADTYESEIDTPRTTLDLGEFYCSSCKRNEYVDDSSQCMVCGHYNHRAEAQVSALLYS